MAASFWINYFLALAVVGLLLGGLYMIVRGLSRGRVIASAGRRMVTVLESTMLAQHVAVHVVKVGTRYFLVGGGNGNVSTLAELQPEEVDAWLAAERSALTGPGRSLLGALARVRGR
ncbi:MAG TPA: flagellar biosynthetic protein FliO [Candidatus Acidoferrales bacterium]|nr:flagellar biosynthetic protein FliO [Candidatus Acidoferrales bacterium]